MVNYGCTLEERDLPNCASEMGKQMSEVMRYRDRMFSEMPHLKFLYWVNLNLSKQNEKHNTYSIISLVPWFCKSQRELEFVSNQNLCCWSCILLSNHNKNLIG